jgi:hypothetical protein
MNRLRCIAVFVGLSAVSAMSLAAQGTNADPDLILQLSREAASAATRALASDESAKSSVDRAAMALVARGDLNSALQTAIALAHDPQFRTKYHELSRDIACYLLEDRKIDAAIEAAGILATSDAFSGDWTTAHMAASLLNLPRPLRPSLKDAPVDTVSLVRRAFSIASSVKDPEAATDLYVTISASLQRRDSTRARIALRAADSTRRLIRDRDRFTSRQAIVAAQAVAVADWALASNIADSIRDRGDIQFVLFRLRAGRDSADSLNKSRNALRAKLQHRLEATPEARAKSIPVNPVDIDD